MKIQRDIFFETSSGTSHHIEITLNIGSQREMSSRLLGELGTENITIGDILSRSVTMIGTILKQEAEAREAQEGGHLAPKSTVEHRPKGRNTKRNVLEKGRNTRRIRKR